MRLGRTAGLAAWGIAMFVGADVSAQQDEPYDPNKNMREDGTTVIKPPLPPDLPNPDRWRYTPAGRIKPGNVLDRFLVSTFITPLFFREEDIGFGGGIAITDIDFRNLGWRELANMEASYSEEGQQRFRFNWNRWLNHRPIDVGGIIRDERSRMSVNVDYSRTLTRRFFGFGSRTPEGAETSYTEERAIVGLATRRSLPDPGSDFLVSGGIQYEHHGLQRGRVTGVPSTDQAFPLVFGDADGVDQLWLSAGAAYDTRDSLAQPYSGWRAGLGVAVAPFQTGLDAGAIFSADLRAAWTVPPLFHDGGSDDEDNPPTDTIVIGGYVDSTAGELPYYSLPSLGGSDTLRGYIQNRFTDRCAAHATIEYRFAVQSRGVRFTDTIRVERVGLALFYDFGTVADDLGDITEGEYLDSYGIGIRAALAREAIFRIDFGVSEEDSLLTISFGNNF